MNQFLSDTNSETAATILAGLAKKTTITKDDVVLLRNSDLMYGLASREDAERMFAIERGGAKKCRAWGDLLVETLVDFVVWGERPAGQLSGDNAKWVVSQAGEKPSPACLAVLIAVLEEAGDAPDWYGSAVRVRARRVLASGVSEPLREAA